MFALSPAQASRIAETVESRAWWALTEAVPVDLATRLGLSIHGHREFTVATCRRFDDFVGNRAFGVDATAPCSISSLSEIIHRFRSQRVRNYALQINPMAQPDGFADWLESNRLECRNRWAVVLRDNRQPPEFAWPHEIRRIAHDDRDDFVATTAAAFGWPAIRAQWMAATIGHEGWHHYLAYDGANPMAAGALFVADGVGWLGMGATLATHRCHGAHTALLNRRIRDAIAMGCRWLVSETGEANPSYRRLRAAGFDLVYWRDNYCEKPRATDCIGAFTGRVGAAVRRRLPAFGSALGN